MQRARESLPALASVLAREGERKPGVRLVGSEEALGRAEGEDGDRNLRTEAGDMSLFDLLRMHNMQELADLLASRATEGHLRECSFFAVCLLTSQQHPRSRTYAHLLLRTPAAYGDELLRSQERPSQPYLNLASEVLQERVAAALQES